MSKVLKTVAAVAGIVAAVALAVPTGGASLAVAGGIAASASTIAVIAAGVSIAANLGAKLTAKRPSLSATRDRLFATLDPNAARKMVFGRTAFATDIWYQAYTGSDKEYYHLIVIAASHKATAIEELWLDDKQAWTSAGGVTSAFSGYLDVTAVLEGNSGNMVTIDSVWSAANNRRLTGCAYLHLRFKLTGNSKKSESPFSSGVTTRMTIIGKGIPVYDPRRDTTVGGSGSHRADDQSTWEWSVSGDEIARNPALCELTHMIGWKIGGKTAVGSGVRLNRIDYASFIAAANTCDVSIALAAGGTELRYRFDGIVSDDEDGPSARRGFEDAMNAELHDRGGRLALQVLVNDIASPVATFGEDDWLGEIEWTPEIPVEMTRNIVRGRYPDPRSNALYQLNEYPQVKIAARDGRNRVLTADFRGVGSPSQCQRLAKQRLQRLLIGGVLRGTVNAKGWGVKKGDPVRVTLARLGFVSKPFRIDEITIDQTGRVPVLLRVEDAALYAWSAEETASPVLAAGVVYDPLKAPLVQQLATIATGADVTAANDPRIAGNFLWSLDADAGGTVAGLPASRRFQTFQGTTDVSTTANAAIATTGSVSASVDNTGGGADRGVVTISACGPSGGSIVLTATLANGAMVKETIAVDVKQAQAAGGTGGSGATSASGHTNGSSASSSFAAIGQEIQVRSDGAGKVRVSFGIGYTGTANCTGQFKLGYATSSGGALTDISGSTVTGTGHILYEDPGAADLAEVHVTLPAANTDYFFRPSGRRSSGSGTMTISGSYTVRQ